MFQRLMNQAGDDGAGGGPGDGDAAATAAAAAAAAAAAGGKKPDGSSVMGAGAEKLEDWIPEKYRAKTADGKGIDVEGSAKAGFKALGELQKRMVDVGLPPESAEKYELESPAGVDVKELAKDPVFASKLKGYHALGMTNKQVQQIINDYAEMVPEIAAAAVEDNQERCLANLALTWKTPEEMAKNIGASHRGATLLAKSLGVSFADIEGYGLANNPMFIRLMTEYARQTGEDVAPLPDAAKVVSSEWADVKKQLDTELEAIPESKPKERRAKLEQITAHYEKRFPKRAPMVNTQRTAA